MDFIDPESVKLGFTVRNNSTTATLQLGSPDPSCLIDRVEVFASGTRIEDISYYNRCSYLYSLLKPEEWWLQRHIQGFLADGGGHAEAIAASGSRTVLMSPHLIGIFACGKMLPPELNLVLQNTFADPSDAVRNVSASQDFSIENVKIYASQVTLDSALRESFQRIMTSGRSLVFSFPTMHSQLSSIPAGSTSYNITVARAFTKMLGAFVTFNRSDLDTVDNFEYAGANVNRNLKSQLQLGALQYPRTANESIAEHHHFLEILAGTYDSKLRNMRIRDNLYGNNQFIAAFPVERVPRHPLSGLSTREVATKPLPDKRAETVTQAASEIIPKLVEEEGNYVVTTDMGNEFQGLEQALPEAAVHRQKRPEDRNATAVIDRAIQTLKKDLAGRAARDRGGWGDHVEQVTSAYNKRPHEAVHAAPEDVEKQPATTFRVYQDNAQKFKHNDA